MTGVSTLEPTFFRTITLSVKQIKLLLRCHGCCAVVDAIVAAMLAIATVAVAVPAAFVAVVAAVVLVALVVVVVLAVVAVFLFLLLFAVASHTHSLLQNVMESLPA